MSQSLRAQYNRAVLLLGSAYTKFRIAGSCNKGVYELIRLTQRANPAAKIPEVKVVDFRDYIGQNEAGNFTLVLVEAIADRFAEKSRLFDVEPPWLFQLCHVSRVWNCRYLSQL